MTFGCYVSLSSKAPKTSVNKRLYQHQHTWLYNDNDDELTNDEENDIVEDLSDDLCALHGRNNEGILITEDEN